MSRLGLSESGLNNQIPLPRDYLKESNIMRSQHSMEAKSSIDGDEEDAKHHGAFAFGKRPQGDDFTSPQTQNFLTKRGFGFPFQNKLAINKDLGFSKVDTCDDTHFTGTNPYALHNTNDTGFHPTYSDDSTSPFSPLRANPISYGGEYPDSGKMVEAPSSSTFNEAIEPISTDLNYKSINPAVNNFIGVWSRVGYDKANDTSRMDNPINLNPSTSYAFAKASPIRNTIRQPNRSTLYENQIPAALRSVLQHENIDYENDFYWMSKFKRDRLTDPVGLERSCVNSKMMLSGMNSFNPVRGLSGSMSIFTDDGDISMTSLINQSSTDFPFHRIASNKPISQPGRSQDHSYINHCQENV